MKLSESESSSLVQAAWRERRTLAQNFTIATIFLLASIIGFPFSIPAGFSLVIMCGVFLRIMLLGDPHWNPRSPDHILIGFTESFMLGALLLSPLAYTLPLLFGQINFMIVVYIITLVLILFQSLRRVDESPQENDEEPLSNRSAWFALLLWIALGAVDLAYSVHMYFGSFADVFFMFGDLTNNLNLIQSIATGTYPPPNLTFLGTSLIENPLALTLSLGYNAMLLATMNMWGYGDLYIIIAKAVIHSAVVPVLYYAGRSVADRVPSWAMLVSTIGLGVSMDLAPVFRFMGEYNDDLNYTVTNEMNRGILFPWDHPIGYPSEFFVPGLGHESALASFHHLLPVLVFLFIIALLLRTNDYKRPAILVAVLAIIELPFFHIGIGFFPMVSIGIVFLGFIVVWLIGRTRVRHRILLFKGLVVLAIVGLFVTKHLVSAFVIITPRFTGFAIVDALAAYLGPFVILGGIGYLMIHFLPERLGKWVLVVWFDFTLLSTLAFSMARDSGIGFMPTDYFPLFNLQAAVVLAFIVGTAYRSSPATIFDLRSWSPNIFSLVKRAEKRLGGILPHKKKAILATRIAFVLALFALGSMHSVWFYQDNLGEFNEYFYGTVPMVSPQERAMYQWVYENTGPTEVILCAPENWEIAAVIGRQIMYSGYREANETDPRYQAYFEMYNSSSLEDAIDLFLENDVTTVIFTPIERARFPLGYSKFQTSALSTLVYGDGQYEVFRIQLGE